jgi:hypothetical protein
MARQQFYPFLSYRHEQIDPGLTATRSEDEDRLKALRALFRIAVKTPGLESFLDCSSSSSFAQMLAPKQSSSEYDKWALAELETFKASVLDAKSESKPFCARLCTTMKVMTTAQMDASEGIDLQQCVPIAWEDSSVHPESPEEGKPFIKLMWLMSAFKLIKGAKQFPSMKIHQTGEGSVAFHLVSCQGTVYHPLHASGIPTPIVTKAFAPLSNTPKVARHPSTVLLRAPRSASHLPDELAVQLSGFLQHRLRAHVIVHLAGPPGSSRLLRIEDAQVRFLKMNEAGNLRPTMRITARLHKSSATCFCRAHLLKAPEKRMGLDFTGKKMASVCFEMCGETLTADGACPTHGGDCTKNEFVPGVCCCNLKVSMSCNHEYRKKQSSYNKPVGVWFPIELKDRFESVELSAFLASASEWHRRATRVFSGEADKCRERLAELVSFTARTLDSRVEKIDRFLLTNPKRMSDADFEVADLVCIEMLEEGGWVQTKPPKKGSRVPKLVHQPTGAEPNTEQKKVLLRHMWLFPRPGEAFGVRGEGQLTPEPTESKPERDAPRAESPPAKRQCVESKEHEYQDLTEFLDVEGMATMRAQVNELLKGDLPKKQRERGEMFLQFLYIMERESGEETEGPLGYRVKPLVCKYKARNDGGRLYATGGETLQKFDGGYAKTCSIQGVPREIRPFLCCRWSHDYDMQNAQPEMLRQMSKILSWTDDRAPPELPVMEEWCAKRKEFIQYVADLHKLPTDDQKWEDYRKDMVKRCVISLMFGGQYSTWRKEVCLDLGRRLEDEPVCQKLVQMEEELAQLRLATFASLEHREFYERDSKRLIREGKKKGKDGKPDMAAIERSVFARIAQREENRVLDIMRAFMAMEGFVVLSLCFDGLMVKHRRDKKPDLQKLNAMIYEKTKVQKRNKETGDVYSVGYTLKVEEKPMYSEAFPQTSLSRV